MEDQSNNLLPLVISAVAVVASLAIGLLNHCTARRAINIAERAEGRRSPHFGIHVHDSTVWQQPCGTTRKYGVYVQFANPTDLPTAIVMADLHITYSMKNRLTTVKVPIIESPTLGQEITVFDLPQPLKANTAASGWLIFHVPEELIGDYAIDRYDIVVRDVHDVIASTQITIFREVSRPI